MPAVAPLPPDVVELRIFFETEGWPWSVRHYLLTSGYEFIDDTYLEAVGLQVALNVVPSYLSVMHNGVVSSACRLIGGGIARTELLAGLRGSHTSATPNSTVGILHWYTSSSSFGKRALTHISGLPYSFTSNDLILSPFGWSQLAGAGTTILRGLQGLPDPVGGAAVPVAVHQRTKDGPLDQAVVAPIVGVRPSAQLSTLRKRLPKRRVPSPAIPVPPF